MSLDWVQWCRQATNEQLGITQEERQFFNSNYHKFCGVSDDMIKKQFGNSIDSDKLFNNFPEEQKLDFSQKVIEKTLILLGKRKRKHDDYEDTGQLGTREIQGQSMLSR